MWFPPQPCVSGRPAPRGRTVTLTVRVCRAERAAAWSRCSRLRYIRADSCHGRSGITRLAVHAASPLLTQEKEDALMLPVHRKHTLINDLFHIGLVFNEWAFFFMSNEAFSAAGRRWYGWIKAVHRIHDRSRRGSPTACQDWGNQRFPDQFYAVLVSHKHKKSTRVRSLTKESVRENTNVQRYSLVLVKLDQNVLRQCFLDFPRMSRWIFVLLTEANGAETLIPRGQFGDRESRTEVFSCC